MTSAGERLRQVETYLNLVRAQTEAPLNRTIDEALEVVAQEFKDEVRERWEREQEVVIRPVNVLSREGGGRRPWFDTYDPANGYHWTRLRNYLLTTKGRSAAIVESIDDASDQVLAHLEDPRLGGPASFRVQGLVLGRVQSGKTANFTAVIAKAVDAGYKYIVVLSGIHNSLRRQTQLRLAEELGLAGASGVGEPQSGRRWITITGTELHADFRAGTHDANVLQGNENVVAVVKKNATVLRRLIGWMEARPADADLPVLIIDDEADQASINTRGNRPRIAQDDEDIDPEDLVDLDPADSEGVLDDELNPSVINGLIREMLRDFDRVSYVAYTATPFANVLIDPDAIDRDAENDLYPRDFLISLPTPDIYVGAERLFGRAPLGSEGDPIDGLDIVRTIPDQDAIYLSPRGNAPWEAQVPDSLRLALIDFVLATAAKQQRLGPGISSMLIHTTHRKEPQVEIGVAVREELTELRQSWRYDPASRGEFSERWNADHRPLIASLNLALDRSFGDIEEEINQLMRDGIEVAVLNSISQDELGYEQDPNRKVVVVGGNRLSRGLTLEDLVVSYYLRSSSSYDTLLQMGRWFGYRDAYVDLTRLWTTNTLYANFRHLALVEEDLREQIAVYEQTGMTPTDVGPMILSHPEMSVTAASKMGAGREIDVSYGGQLVQSVRFNLDDPEWLESNLHATRDFVSTLGATDEPIDDRPDDRPHWRNVQWQVIVEYLQRFQSPSAANSFHSIEMADYIRRQAEQHGELERWWVSVRSRQTAANNLGTIDLGIVGGAPVNAVSRTRLLSDPQSVGVLTNPARATGPIRQGEEEVGLTDSQISTAREQHAEGVYRQIGTCLRQQRQPQEGLLCIFPISERSDVVAGESSRRRNRAKLFDDSDKARPVVGLAVVFPPSRSAATHTRIGGPAADGGL